MLTPYPAALSFEAVSLCAGWFRGTVLLEAAVHGAWDLLGFGLGIGLPDGDGPPRAEELPSGEEAALALESLLPSDAAESPRAAVPWAVILALVIQILQAWLKK